MDLQPHDPTPPRLPGRPAHGDVLAALMCLTLLGCAPRTSPPVVAPPRSTPTSPGAGPVLSRPDPLQPAIAALIAQAEKRGRIAGLTIGLQRRGQPPLFVSYGLADLAAARPATPETPFRIGSITKVFTAVAILQLAEQQRLRLDDPLGRFLPDYPEPGARVTLRQLLTHTSGIPSYTSLPTWKTHQNRRLTDAELLAAFNRLPLEFTPGERFSYSNSGYYLLGLVVERASGSSYADYVATRIAGPLGLTSTVYCDARAGKLSPAPARGYALGPKGLRDAAPLQMSHPGAAGGLCSSAVDLLRFAASLESGKLISQHSLQTMRTAFLHPDGAPGTYGLGLFVGRVLGRPYFGHGGGINGFASQLRHYPEDGLTLVVLANREDALAASTEEALARAALGVVETPPRDLAVDPAARARWAGRYQVPGALDLQIVADSDRLWLEIVPKPPAGPGATLPKPRPPLRFKLLYQGANAGSEALVSPQLKLSLELLGHGAARRLWLDQRGVRLPVRRLN